MAKANLKSITPDEYELDLPAALSLAAQAESRAREAVGWAQIIGTRLNGLHLNLAGEDVLCRCAGELGDAALDVCQAAEALRRMARGE